MVRSVGLLLVTAVAGAAAQASLSGSCHADVLVNNAKVSALSSHEVQQICQVVAQTIAAETGHTPGEVMTRVFSGDYNAPWSPSQNRPSADLFIASIIQNCQAPKVVLAKFKSLALAQKLLSALNPVVSSSSALTGPLTVGATSVIPANMDASAIPTPAPTDSASGGSSFGGFIAILALLGLAAGAGYFYVMNKQRDRDDSEDETAPFTGH